MVTGDHTRLRAELTTFPPYVPGLAPAQVPGLIPYRLSSNENHLEPLPAVRAELDRPHDPPALYPDDAAIDLRRRVSAVHDVPMERTIVTADTTLILLCSPNNPTGAVLTHAELEDFLARVPSTVLVVLDEAYREFATDPAAARGQELQERHPNLVLARTFSKAHGLAGLRVGFAIAHEDIIGGFLKAIIPFGVTQRSQRAAAVSLDHHAEALARARTIAGIRDDFAEALRAQGWRVPQAQGNFFWLRLGEHSDAFELAANQQALAVRNLDDGVRISVGPAEALDRVLEVGRTFLVDHPDLFDPQGQTGQGDGT